MNELKQITNQIMDVYNEEIPNNEKHKLLSALWTHYYKKSFELGIQSHDAYNLYLIGESESFILDQPPILKEVKSDKLEFALSHLKEVLCADSIDGITEEEAQTILCAVVYQSRTYLSTLGINIQTNSLNGFCELSQALTIMPLENIGLPVTKNSATEDFAYPFNHRFGTVSFPILENGTVQWKNYLLDVTYRQFFATVRCNEGRYYTEEENLKIPTAPDPGYFVKDTEFARELLAHGFIELNEKTATLYGEPFYLSSLTRESSPRKAPTDYLSKILFSQEKYAVDINELNSYGFDLEFPSGAKKR